MHSSRMSASLRSIRNRRRHRILSRPTRMVFQPTSFVNVLWALSKACKPATVTQAIFTIGYSTRSAGGLPNTSCCRTTKSFGNKIGRAQSELQSQSNLVCRLLLEKKKNYDSHLTTLSCAPVRDTV